jgi:ferredoxin-type protein NapG
MSEPDMNRPSEPRPDRRQFFLRGFSEVLGGLLKAVEGRPGLEQLRSIAGVEPLASPRSVLRPPGALPEAAFLRTCYRCGSCMDACPVHALQPVQGQDEDLAGTPQLDPDLQICEKCPALPCVHACPSGALVRPGGTADKPS